MLRRYLPYAMLLLILSACYQAAPQSGQGNSDPAQSRVSLPRPAKTVLINGSAIVAMLIKNIATSFNTFTPGYIVQVATDGTLDGFKLFCSDESDVQQAVRAMQGDEAGLCLRNGIDYLQLTLAYDVLAVVGNAPVQGCLSASELAFLYSHDVSHLQWSSLRPGLPAQAIQLYAPLPNTAASQFLSDQLLGGAAALSNPDIQLLGSARSGIGYLPLPQAQKLTEQNSGFTLIALDSGSGCTVPSVNTVLDGSYALLSRPLYLYVNKQSVRRSAVFRFLSYAFSTTSQRLMGDSGFVAASPQTYLDAQTQFDQAATN
ncbi:MAG TPA: substrate-binding domain-containing protein [Aggregatilineales bacterium]|nr:substrate-binding domain-containing protein [Aggregatilineales bacterium]